MIEVTQEMRDTAYREEGIIPYLKDTIKKVNEDEFRRAGADPVGISDKKNTPLTPTESGGALPPVINCLHFQQGTD